MALMAAMAGLTASAERAQAAGPSLTVPLTSNDAVGMKVGRQGKGAAISAALGMWSDDGAVELGGFRDGPARDIDPSLARAAELVSGKAMQSRGLRLSGTLGGQQGHGWALGVEARRQQVTDIGAALSGAWRRSSDSRLSVSGKLKF
jgi:hypothetical protein